MHVPFSPLKCGHAMFSRLLGSVDRLCFFPVSAFEGKGMWTRVDCQVGALVFYQAMCLYLAKVFIIAVNYSNGSSSMKFF